MRDGALPPGRRQGGLHLRGAHHQTAPRQTLQRARKARPWPPCDAHLLQESCGPHVRKVQHLPAGRSLCKPDERSWPHKGLENLECLRQKLIAVTDRFAGFEAESLNVHVDFPLFQKMALPVMAGKTKIAGIKIHDTRMMRLMEVLLHGGTQLNGWRSADIHQAILATFGLSAATYTLTQLRYDLRKLKAHRLLERI